MHTVYVIQSLRNGKRYVGCTGKRPEERLAEHNRGCNKWARANRPFRLIYTEVYDSQSEARQRERFLKSGQGRKLLNGRIPR
ncbi:GIY-YIG nuclease family protein [candidate division WOR-3 bacterium]|nr:GIY-YIG nuclease family protein [candidate division WOR-3 bacterium]